MADKKPTNREKLNEITASIERGIKELFQSDKYAEYLRTMSKFHGYSVRNILREFVEQIRVSETYTTDEQQKRVKIREIVYNFIGAFDFEGARERSQTAQDKNTAKVGAA